MARREALYNTIKFKQLFENSLNSVKIAFWGLTQTIVKDDRRHTLARV